MTGLVLAAGAGRRFGRPKALIELDGTRLIDRAVALLGEGGCDRVVVVSGAVELAVPGAEVVPNPLWETGMGSSLRAGLTAIGGEDVVVVPVDMPWLGAEAVRRVAAAGSSLAVATYGGIRAHPVLLGADHHAGVIDSASGDAGARHYLRAHSHLVTEVPCDGTGSPRDVDRPEDLASATGDHRGAY
ncbi:nucleotidyltransferase family protein [Dietzia cinnamea]|uniref:nucleotidyltransferase family protein n=2 Tax=Dietzia cinnamea TaxID=321318 RepID=UPI00223B4120|nr:nucleotidyltransferase family protein [Dietzia cinnamea]MCT2105806.1 nucleotidyltransferase family protein [Dietzia cinnamea]